MIGINVGPYAVRLPEVWRYSTPSIGIPVGNSVTIAPAAGPGRRQYLASMQFTALGEGTAEVIIKTGSQVLFALTLIAGFPTLPTFPVPLVSADNEALVLEVAGTDGAVFLNAQGFTGK